MTKNLVGLFILVSKGGDTADPQPLGPVMSDN